MKKKTYYKVVSINPEDGKFYSARARVSDREVEYIPNKWVSAPEGTRLFVFDDLNKARKFLADGKRLENGIDFKKRPEKLFECEIIGNIKGRGAYDNHYIEKFWETFTDFLSENKKKRFDFYAFRELFNMPLTSIPAVFAKKVKLVKEII